MEKKDWELTIGERIEKLALAKAATINAFATKCMKHDTNSSIAGAIRSNNPKYETLQELLDKTEVSATWLMTGRGDMFHEPVNQSAEDPTTKALDIVERTIIRITDGHKNEIAILDRVLQTYEGIMKANKIIA